MYKQIEVRDELSLHVFVKHRAIAPNGKEMWPIDGNHIYFPKNLGKNDSTVGEHQFKIDFVVKYPENHGDLILHWGVGLKNKGEWSKIAKTPFGATERSEWHIFDEDDFP